MTEDDLIDTPYGKKRWGFLKHCMDCHDEMLDALKIALPTLTDEAYLYEVDSEDGISEDNPLFASIQMVKQAINKAKGK